LIGITNEDTVVVTGADIYIYIYIRHRNYCYISWHYFECYI